MIHLIAHERSLLGPKAETASPASSSLEPKWMSQGLIVGSNWPHS